MSADEKRMLWIAARTEAETVVGQRDLDRATGTPGAGRVWTSRDAGAKLTNRAAEE